jgi:Protein of unknown function (DUF2721)
MKIDITTPALLFPAISLLMLAYTNRYLAFAAVIRQLHTEYRTNLDQNYLEQIRNLRSRMRLVRNMQFFGVASLLLCTVCMFCVFLNFGCAALALFTASILLMIVSLLYSLVEIVQSVNAIDLHLIDIEDAAARQRKQDGPSGGTP